MTTQTSAAVREQARTFNAMGAGLWLAQVLLMGFYAMTGFMHSFMAPEALVQMGVAWVQSAPIGLVRFIGIAELAGAIGVLLPAVTRILPGLTPAAALGLTAIQVLAIPFHLYRGEIAPLPFNLTLLALSVFVLWGRARRAPIASRY